eukprot:6928613-Ditylum_brightwellii.AAC.1
MKSPLRTTPLGSTKKPDYNVRPWTPLDRAMVRLLLCVPPDPLGSYHGTIIMRAPDSLGSYHGTIIKRVESGFV